MIVSIMITMIGLFLLCMFLRDITPVIVRRVMDYRTYRRMEDYDMEEGKEK